MGVVKSGIYNYCGCGKKRYEYCTRAWSQQVSLVGVVKSGIYIYHYCGCGQNRYKDHCGCGQVYILILSHTSAHGQALLFIPVHVTIMVTGMCAITVVSRPFLCVPIKDSTEVFVGVVTRPHWLLSTRVAQVKERRLCGNGNGPRERPTVDKGAA